MITPTRINEKMVQVRCVWCDQRFDIPYSIEQEQAVKAGAHLITVAGELDADSRELLISGTCPTCWNETFGDEE